MSLNGIISSGLSAVLTNSAALKVTSDNIANVNTAGYHRRVAQLGTQVAGGVMGGVTMADIRRITDQFLDQASLSATSLSERYGTQTTLLDQLDAALGQPGDGTSVLSRLDNLYGALGQLSLDPTSFARRQGALNQFQNLAQSVSSLSQSIASIRQAADQQVQTEVSQANSLIGQILDLNISIQHATAVGNEASGERDQRDQLISQLAGIVAIKTTEQSDGRMFISTPDGTSLIGDMRVQFAYTASGGQSFPAITMQTVQTSTNNLLGTPQSFDVHVAGGRLRGLMDMRDGILVDVGSELGMMAQSLALTFNAVHNASTAVPPPPSFTGRQTGLLAGDALNFTGDTVIGIADVSGTLQHKIAIDFDAGTMQIDGAGPIGLSSTIGGFTTDLNAALGVNGTASFTNGVLSISANGSNGLVIADDPTTPSSRGGTGFSQFFGLNDLFTASGNAIRTTGLAASDAHGLLGGGSITMTLKSATGQRSQPIVVPVTGTTVGDMVTALNTAFSGMGSFALDANGQLTMTPSAAYAGYRLDVEQDSTQRGATGVSFSQIFGLGVIQSFETARNFSLTDALANSAQNLALAQSSLTASSALGTQIASAGDNAGAIALQDLNENNIAFGAAGVLSARTTTLSDYISTLYQDIAGRGAEADEFKTTAEARLAQAEERQGATEGVNMDEELSNMMQQQQAYNAGARLLKVAQELLDELLRAV